MTGRRSAIARGGAAVLAIASAAACRDATSTSTPTPTSNATSNTTATAIVIPTSTAGAPALLPAADGRLVRVRPLGPSGMLTTGYARAVIYTGDLRLDAALSRSPLQAQTAWGTATFGGRWPDDAWSVQLAGAPGKVTQTILQWKRDHWVKVEEAPARDVPSQIAAWSADSALALDAAKDCGTLRVVGADAKKPAPQLDKRLCPQRMLELASGEIVVAGRGFMQRLTKGQAAAPAAQVLPWGESDKCPTATLVVGSIATTERGIFVAGRCANADILLLEYDGAVWNKLDGPDDASLPVAAYRSKEGHQWVLTAKRGHEAELGERPPVAGSLWFRPKGGLWNRVHMKGTLPAEAAEDGVDAAAVACTPTSFWARQDDDLWATYDCRAGDGDKAPSWSFAYRTGSAGGKSVRITR